MSRAGIQPSQQKLAEKLTILNDRGIGMLTRVYNIKKVGAHTHTVVTIHPGKLHANQDRILPES